MNRLIAFINGIREYRNSFSHFYPDVRDARAYDMGRELAHRITFRRYETR